MKKRIKKLTPTLLKRIIKEEKDKLLKNSGNAPNKTKQKKSSSRLSEIKKIRLIKNRQRKLIREFKMLNKQRKRLKKSLLARS